MTWNPIQMRCTPISAGCANCWHLQFAKRHAGNPTFNKQKRAAYAGGKPRVDINEHSAPSRRKKSSMIAVMFMGDLFHESIMDTQIGGVFGCMEGSPRHTFLVLTKRAERMMRWVTEWKKKIDYMADHPAPQEGLYLKRYGHIWLGVSVEDQAAADERIPLLLQTPAAIRWVSVEPMLGPVDLRGQAKGYGFGWIDWVVCGAETGLHKRPCNPEWTDSLRGQCTAAGVPFFGKVDQDGNPIEPRQMPGGIPQTKSEQPKKRCPYGCEFDPKQDPYHIEGCADQNRP